MSPTNEIFSPQFAQMFWLPRPQSSEKKKSETPKQIFKNHCPEKNHRWYVFNPIFPIRTLKYPPKTLPQDFPSCKYHPVIFSLVLRTLFGVISHTFTKPARPENIRKPLPTTNTPSNGSWFWRWGATKPSRPQYDPQNCWNCFFMGREGIFEGGGITQL